MVDLEITVGWKKFDRKSPSMSTKTLMTAQEFAQMQTPETEDFELVDGELIRLRTERLQQMLDSPLLPGFAVAVADLVLKPY